MEIDENDLKASNGWLQTFWKIFNVGVALLHGKGRKVDRNDPELLEKIQILKEFISKYAYKNVYNMDETDYFLD